MQDKLDVDLSNADPTTSTYIYMKKNTGMRIRAEIVLYTSVLLCLCVFQAEQNVTTSANQGLYFSITKFRTGGEKYTTSKLTNYATNTKIV